MLLLYRQTGDLAGQRLFTLRVYSGNNKAMLSGTPNHILVTVSNTDIEGGILWSSYHVYVSYSLLRIPEVNRGFFQPVLEDMAVAGLAVKRVLKLFFCLENAGLLLLKK